MKTREVGWGAIISYIAIGFNILAGILYTPWMIRTIGSSNYALYTLALSVINLFLFDFGIGASISKFLTGFYARDEEDKVASFLGTVYKLYLVISFVILIAFVVVYLNIESIYTKLTPSELDIFKGLFIIASVCSIMSFPFQPLNGILMANEKFIFLKLCNLLQKVLSVLLIILSLMLGGNVYSLVLANAFSNIVFIITKLYYVNRSGVKVSLARNDANNVHEIFNCSIWMTVIQISQRFIFNIAPTILAVVLGSSEITIFSLAATIEGYVFTFGDALSGMFMPEVARNYVDNDFISKTDELMIKVGRILLYVIGLLVIGITCMGPSFIRVWMGKGYEKVYLCTVLLVLPSLVDVPLQIGRTAILISDNVKWQALIYVIMAVLNISISFPLSTFFGVYGTALAVLIAYFIRTFGIIFILKNKVGLHIKEYFKKTYITWIIPAAITIVVGFWMEHTITAIGWRYLSVKIVCIVFVYAICLYLFSIKSTERKKVKNMLTRRMSGGLH